MALSMSRFLRRAGASAVPSLLLRDVSVAASVSSCASRPLALLSLSPQPQPQPWGLFSSLFFSSSAMPSNKPSSDASLLRVIESEIKCAEECDDHDRDLSEEVPDGFPFEMEDQAGTNIVRLTRTYQGKEHIEVTVSMPSLVTGEEDEGANEQDQQSQSQSHVPLTVRVSKDGGPTLEFVCTAYPDEVVIDSMSVFETPPEGEEDDLLSYEGPDFNDLDENLQKAFHKYLELRGITLLNTNFLHEYMINKDSREYLLWLRNLKDFVLK